MRQRCFLKTCKAFPRYGGRGITVCDRWANSFEAFLEDMGEPPIGYSIERREVNGNYEPRNCEWIPRWDQAHNRENTMYVEVAGEKIRLVELADAIGIARHRLYERLARHGTIYGKAPHVRRATEAAIAKWKALAVTTLL